MRSEKGRQEAPSRALEEGGRAPGSSGGTRSAAETRVAGPLGNGWPLLLLGLIALGLFADALLPSRTLIPTGFLYQRQPWANQAAALAGDAAQQYDLLHQFYPWARFYRESVLSGQVPLWDPHSYLGTPFWANPQTAVLFPGTWLHLLMPPEHSFTLLFILKAALGLMGMFLWLRRGGLQTSAALLGAAVFGLSTHTLVSLAFPYSTVTVLFPWALLALDGLLRARTSSRRSLAGSWTALALSVALLVSAGQPQSALAALGALALYGILRLIQPARLRGGEGASTAQAAPLPGRRLITVLLASSAALAGALLCAVQWLPALDYVSESMIGRGPRILSSGLPYLPGNLLNFLVPDLFGSPLRDDFWGFPGYHDAAFYSSLIALLMAPFAFLRLSPNDLGTAQKASGESPGQRESGDLSKKTGPGEAPFWSHPALTAGGGPLFPALLGLISLGIMLGLPPLESLLDLPGFDLIRRNKVAFLAVFALASLAAQGCGRLLHRLTEGSGEESSGSGTTRRHSTAAALKGALLVWAGLLAASVVAALSFFGSQRTHFSGGSLTQPEPWIALAVLAAASAAFLAAPGPWRARLVAGLVTLELLLGGFGLNPRGSSQALFPPLPVLQEHLEGPMPRVYSTRHTLLAPNSAMVYGLQDVRGYDVMTPRRLFRYMQAIDPSLGDEWTALQALPRDQLHPQSRMLKAFGRTLESRWGPALEEYLKGESYWSVSASRITRSDLFQRLNIEWLWTLPQQAPPPYRPAAGGHPLTLHRNPQAASAAIFLEWVEAGDAAEALRRLRQLGVPTDAGTAGSQTGNAAGANPATVSPGAAVVEADLPDLSPSSDRQGRPRPEAAAKAAGQAAWQLVEASPTRRAYRVSTPSPAVFADLGRYSPGWVVRVNGAQTPAFPVDSLFRGVFLLPGEHQVEFLYQPASFRLGALLSGLALILCLGVWAWGKIAPP